MWFTTVYVQQTIEEENLKVKADKLYVPGYDVPIELGFEPDYQDMFHEK